MSYSFKLLSHENKLLIDHLRNVASICKERVEQSVIDFIFPKRILADVASIIGVAHDLGKGTSYFQTYLRQSILGNAPQKDMELRSHGFLSSIFAFILVRQYLINIGCKEERLESFLPYIASFVVKHHHGNLADYDDETMFNRIRLEKVVKKQLEALYMEEIVRIIEQLLNIYYDNDTLKRSFIDAFECTSFETIESEEVLDEIRAEQNSQYYILQKYLFSVLIYADKWDVILGAERRDQQSIPADLIDIYLKNKQKDGTYKKEDFINLERQKAYTEVMDTLDDLSLDNRIYSISLPTGLGKTFTSTSLALKLREKLSEGIKRYKIVYSLPFTSIIDQNFSVIEEVYHAVTRHKPLTSTLLKHHYLSDVFYYGKQEYDIDKSSQLIDSWESSMIITTFVQFFHTLFGNRNKPLVKFSSMQNSIVILDEVQSIPYKYWLLLNQFLPEIAKRLNMYYILVTATQPLIFDEKKDEIKELVYRKKEFFSLFNRTTIFPRVENTMDIDDFCSEMLDLINAYPKEDILIILNTIKSAKRVYNFLEENYTNDYGQHTSFIFLSTAVIPKHRSNRIRSIRETSGKRQIIVSTQLVEAGVDIDMDIVVRDIGPWDSIIQAAGRANRNNRNKLGHVYVYVLKNHHKEFYRYIYKENFITIQKTLELLKSRDEIHETEYGTLTEEYYRKIHYDGDGSADTSSSLLNYIWEMRFEAVDREFQLIEKLPNKVDVFVEVDDDAKKIWQYFQELKNISSPFERKRKFSEIKNEFYQYVISVDSKEITLDDCGWIGYISKEQLPNMYNYITGYEPVDEDTIV